MAGGGEPLPAEPGVRRDARLPRHCRHHRALRHTNHFRPRHSQVVFL